MTHVNKVKYPRTYHLPWSENVSDDDRYMDSVEWFEGEDIVVTEKMDGENTTMYHHGIHARSVNSRPHVSQEWVKNFHASIAHNIPEGWRVCGENMFAKHSIAYENLPSYFLGFSIWNEKNYCLPWDDTIEWFELLGITPVRVLYRGTFDYDLKNRLAKELSWETSEGYVLRFSAGFYLNSFSRSVGKFVRKNHIQTIQHWRYGQPVVRNKLA